MGHSASPIWQVMQSKGYSRRDFIRFCTFAAAVAGIEATGLTKVVRAFEKKGVRLLFGFIFRNALVAASHSSALLIRS